VEFLYSGCGGNGNRFSTVSDCESTCASSAVEKRIEKDERERTGTAAPTPPSSSSAATVAEAVLSLVLLVLVGCAVGLAIKYYRVRKAKDNYRQFDHEQRRADSVSSRTGPLPDHLAYDNPTYSASDGDAISPDCIQMNGLRSASTDRTESPFS
jgi:hypothetical protein